MSCIATTGAVCRHCVRRPAYKPRGLCHVCYYVPGVRERFPSTSKFARRGVGHGCRGYALPDSPTDAMPGSEAKIAVLCERFAAGVALWHPHDASDVLHLKPNWHERARFRYRDRARFQLKKGA